MKQTNLLKTFLLLCALIVGSTCAWADGADWSYTVVSGDGSKLNTSTKTFTVDADHVWSYASSSNGQGTPGVSVGSADGKYAIKFGSSKTVYFNPVILSTDAFASVNVTKVSIYVKHNGKKDGALTVKQGDVTIGTASVTNSNTWVTLTSSETNKGNGGTLEIKYEVDQALYINKIEVWYEESSKTATTVTIDASGITNTNVATGTAAGSLSASVTAGGNPVLGATITWTSSKEDVATISSAGVVTLVAEGKTTITASYAGDETYLPASKTYELTVTDPRTETGLAYAEATQNIEVGQTLNAPTLTNPNSLAVIFESSNNAIATVDGSGNVTGVAAGSATITASFAGNSTYKPGSASYTVVVKNATPAGALLWETVSGRTEGSGDISTALTPENAYLDSDNWKSFTKVYPGKILDGDVNSHLKFGSSSDAGVAVTKSIALTGTGKLTYKVQRYDSNNAGNLTISVTGATATGDVDVEGTAEWVEKTVNLTDATGNVVITFATTSTDTRIRVDDILLVATKSATVSDAGWATYVTPCNLEFAEGDAFVVSAATASTATLAPVTKIGANKAVLLKGEGVKTATVLNEAPAAVANELAISNGGSVDGFVLAKKNGTVGFYKWNGGSLTSGKVYLPTPAGARDYLEFSFSDGEVTAIDAVKTQKANNEYYNLAGQRVAQPTKGLYIVNGKKVIIK